MQSFPASTLPPPPRPAAIWLTAMKVAGIYAGLSTVWIVVSDYVVFSRTGANYEMLWMEIGKGLGFVAVTAALLVLLVRHYLRKQQQAEILRWAGEPQFRSLVEQSIVGVYLFQDNRIVYVNPRAAEIFGYPAEEITGRLTVADLVAAADRPLVLERLASRVRGENPEGVLSFRGLHRNGWPLQLEAFGSLVEHLGRPAVIGTLLDVTDRHEAEAALRESEARYRLLIQAAPDAIVVLDMDQGRFVDCNRQAERLFELSGEELTRVGPVELSPETQPDGRRSAEAAKGYIEQAVAGGTPSFEWLHRNRTGREIPCVIRLARLPAQGRTLIRGSITDITEQRRAEEQRRKLEEELRQAQKLQAIGTLAGGIAHDFNNILAAILGNAQLLKLSLTPGDEGQGKISQIIAASNRAKDLVQQILMFSRQQEQERRVLPLGPVVIEATRLIEVNLPFTIRLQLNAPPHLPAVLADPTQIHQVVVNLCTNALHAMRDCGGTLRVALSAVQLPETAAHSKPGLPPGRYLCLEVSDTGHGMTAATLERIYEPFFTTKAVGDGTGLGLAVVHGIVQSHNGGISVTSKPGEGTTFRLYFPTEADLAAPPARLAAALATGQDQHIVFVDDEGPIAEVARVMLPRLGYRVAVFTKPSEALEYIRAHSAGIDLLMSDLSMPGLSGVDLIREAVRLKPGLPSILLTGYGKALDSRAALDLNIREVVTKPFTMETLAGAVAAAFSER